MTMTTAFKLFFTRTFDCGGRTSRREFWLGVLPNAIIMLVLIALVVVAWVCRSSRDVFRIVSLVLLGVFCLIEIFPSISLILRRMHDVGKSGFYIFVLLIPIVGFVWYIYLVTRRTDYYKKA